MDTMSYIIGRNSAGGGGTGSTPSWSDVTNKPFETIGTGLTVTAGALNATGGGSGVTPTWSEITSKPFSSVDTEGGLSIYDDTLMIDTLDKIATINYVDTQVDGITTNYALKSEIPSISVTQGLTTGVTVGSIDIDGTTTTFYAPAGGGSADWADITSKPNLEAGESNGSLVNEDAQTFQIKVTGTANTTTYAFGKVMYLYPNIFSLLNTNSNTDTNLDKAIVGAETNYNNQVHTVTGLSRRYASGAWNQITFDTTLDAENNLSDTVITLTIPNSRNGRFSTIEGLENSNTSNMSHVEGQGNIITDSTTGNVGTAGVCHHAEGQCNTIVGAPDKICCHVEGVFNTVRGSCAHAEGYATSAGGSNSHTEGEYTETGARDCHAEGFYTQAYGIYQHVQGRYNVYDDTKFADIVGNGDSGSNRSNAEATDWDGNKYLAGNIYTNVIDWSNPQSGSVKLANIPAMNGTNYVDPDGLIQQAQDLIDNQSTDEWGNTEYTGEIDKRYQIQYLDGTPASTFDPSADSGTLLTGYYWVCVTANPIGNPNYGVEPEEGGEEEPTDGE